jgi:hypothetical protein
MLHRGHCSGHLLWHRIVGLFLWILIVPLFRRFQVEDRSYSGYPIKEFTKFSSFDFIDSSIAICVFFQPSQTFLCVLDVNLERGKLIVHQLVDLNHEGINGKLNLPI